MSDKTKMLIEGALVAAFTGALPVIAEFFKAQGGLKGIAIAGAVGGLLAWLKASPLSK